MSSLTLVICEVHRWCSQCFVIIEQNTICRLFGKLNVGVLETIQCPGGAVIQESSSSSSCKIPVKSIVHLIKFINIKHRQRMSVCFLSFLYRGWHLRLSYWLPVMGRLITFVLSLPHNNAPSILSAM